MTSNAELHWTERLHARCRQWVGRNPRFIKKKLLMLTAKLFIRHLKSLPVPKAERTVATNQIVDADLPFYAVSQNVVSGRFMGGTFVVRNQKTKRVVVCHANKSSELSIRFPNGYEVVQPGEFKHLETEAHCLSPGTAKPENCIIQPSNEPVFGNFESK